MRNLLLALLLFIFVMPVFAQDDPAFETVEIAASDELALIGDYYLPENVDGEAPAVLLLHMLGSERSAYDPLIPYLLDAGYVILNVDMRGHGATGGSRDWDLAIDDAQLWFDWLREQETVDDARVAVIGASIGSNVALIACGNDEACVTAVALSPGEDYRGVMPGDAVANGLNAFLIAAHGDRASAEAIQAFFSDATGYVNARLYPGSAHGTRLFNDSLDSVAGAIIDWLDEQFDAVQEA